MTPQELTHVRMANQQIEGSACTTVAGLVSWMGAMQAQDYAQAKWAIGKRLPGSTDILVEAAYNRGDILRTHLMRPTWHFVAADDLYWMMDLTAPQVKRLLKSRDKQLELTEHIFSKSRDLLERLLSNELSMTREELTGEYANIHIATNENRLSHLMLRAELDGIVCSGPIRKNRLTYSLLADRVPVKKTLSRDEALATLATRYFNCHGPATLRDFIWWSGLPVSDARKALEMIKSSFQSEMIGAETYWFGGTLKTTPPLSPAVHLLPAFDEYLISYTDRSAALASEHNRKAITVSGIFRPVIVVDGQVEGLWKRNTVRDLVKIETSHFRLHDPATRQGIEDEAARYGLFLGKQVELSSLQHPDSE